MPMNAIERLSQRINAIVGGHGFVTLSVSDARALLASCDTRRMAETGNTDSVRSTGGAVPNRADAQTPPKEYP